MEFWDGNHLLTAWLQVKASTAGSGCATAPHHCHRDTVTACHSPEVPLGMGLCEDPAQLGQTSIQPLLGSTGTCLEMPAIQLETLREPHPLQALSVIRFHI